MAISANIGYFKGEFVAELSDGRRLEDKEWRGMAESLFCAGIRAKDVNFEWRNGHRMITAGQQVALLSEIRRLSQQLGLHEAAA